MIKTLSVMFVFAAAAMAQPIGVGLKVGLPLTDAFDIATGPSSSYVSDTDRCDHWASGGATVAGRLCNRSGRSVYQTELFICE